MGLRLSLRPSQLFKGVQSISPEMRRTAATRPLDRTLGLYAAFGLFELFVELLVEEAEKLANVP